MLYNAVWTKKNASLSFFPVVLEVFYSEWPIKPIVKWAKSGLRGGGRGEDGD